MLLNNEQIIEETKKQIKICIEMNENENTITQNLWDTVKGLISFKVDWFDHLVIQGTLKSLL